MSFTSLNLGTTADDGTGTTARAGGQIINDNFAGVVFPPTPIFHMPLDHGIDYPLGKGTATFARTSTGYIQDPIDNSFTSASTNVVRTVAGRGMMFEEERTNLCLYSQDFTDATWTKTNATIGSTTGPYAETAHTITDDATSGNHLIVQTITVVDATQYTFSVVAKAGTLTWMALYESSSNSGRYFNLSTGALGGTISGTPTNSYTVDLGGGWYECVITFTSSGTSSNVEIRCASADNTSSYSGSSQLINVSSPQLEAGWGRSTFIPTVAASVQRTADQLTVLKAGNTMNDNPMSVSCTIRPNFVGGAQQMILKVHDEAQSFSIKLNASGKLESFWNATTVTHDDVLVAGTEYKVVMVHNGTSLTLYVNGSSKSATAATGAATAEGASFWVGQNSDNTLYFNGFIRDLKIYPTNLSAIQAHIVGY